jgi:hypothetical protein
MGHEDGQGRQGGDERTRRWSIPPGATAPRVLSVQILTTCIRPPARFPCIRATARCDDVENATEGFDLARARELASANDRCVATPDPVSASALEAFNTLFSWKEARDVRSKFGVFISALAVAALGMLLFGSALAGADGKGKRTLRLKAKEIQSEFLDHGAPGASLGDEFVFSETLSRRGREVGTSGGVCTATEVVPPYDIVTFHCVATLSLRRGQITLQGLIEIQGEDDPGPFKVAITGGTGKFRGASGEAVVRDVRPGRTVYKLRFDKKHDSHKKKRKKKHRD